MNKLCSRNTALATAAGRSGCRAPVVSRPLAVFSPFGVLVPFALSLAPFIFLPLLSLSLSLSSCIPLRYPCSRASLSRSRRRISVSRSFTLSLSFQACFFLPRTTLLRTSAVSPLSRSLCFFVASVNDPGTSLRPHSSSRSLLRPRSRATPRAAAAMSQSAHGIPRSLSRSSAESVCRRPNKYQINETAARNLDVLITGV